VIDFSNGQGKQSISFSVSAWSNLPALGIWDTSSYWIGNFISTKALVNNQWQFLVTSFDGSKVSLYINGTLILNQTTAFYSLPTVTRTQIWIGKSSWATDDYSSSYLDDLRFYNISLSQAQILELMLMNNQTTTTTFSTENGIHFFSIVGL
jgi:hypothetical protein